MELYCGPPVFFDLHLSGFPNHETLFLRDLWAAIKDDATNKEPLSLGGQWCAGSNQCVTVKSTIQFRKFNLDKKASGTYVIDLKDGGKMQGAFSVIRMPYKKPFLCE